MKCTFTVITPDCSVISTSSSSYWKEGKWVISFGNVVRHINHSKMEVILLFHAEFFHQLPYVPTVYPKCMGYISTIEPHPGKSSFFCRVSLTVWFISVADTNGTFFSWEVFDLRFKGLILKDHQTTSFSRDWNVTRWKHLDFVDYTDQPIYF